MKNIFLFFLLIAATNYSPAQFDKELKSMDDRLASKSIFPKSLLNLSNTNIQPGQFTLKPDNKGILNFDTTLAKNLQHAIDSMQAKDFPTKGISAAVLIPGKGTWVGVSGFSNPSESINSDMLFHIGSNTKGFISAILLQLQEEGKLSLDDSIGKYLPPFPNISGSITIRQLLSMRSGLSDNGEGKAWRDSIFADVNRIWTPEEIIKKFVGPPKTAPGGKYSYCGTNLLLAGLVIREVTKSSISAQLHQRIFTPLSMSHTFFPEEDSVIGKIPTPWYNGIDKTLFCGKAYHSWCWTAGAMLSTAEDAARWSSAFYGGEILTPSSQAQLLTTSPMYEGYGNGFYADGYGLTVVHLSYLGKELYGHPGATDGFSSDIMYYPKTGVSIAVLCNTFLPGFPPDDAISALWHEYFKTIQTENVTRGKSYVFGGTSASTYDLDISSAKLTPLGKSRYGTILSCRNRPGTNELYGISNALGVELVQIDGTTGEAYPRKVIKFPNTVSDVKGMAFKSKDTLYIGCIDGRLFKVDFQTGIATQVASTGLVIAGLDFNPKSGQLWASSRHTLTVKKDLIYKINLPSGDTVRVGATGFGAKTPDIAFDESGNLYGLIGNETQNNGLARIDTSTGVGTIVGLFGISKLNALAFLPTITSVASNVLYPSEFILAQNYPNPFNPTTTIRYSLPNNSQVKLTIHDMLGREVTTLVNEEQSSGWKEVQWNASALSSGIYFYKITAGSFVETKKCLVVK